MSLLVKYTLKSADDHANLAGAMDAMVEGLKAEGERGFTYSCFETEDPIEFVGLLEFEDDAGKAAFVASGAFATYRETVTPLLIGPPSTTDLSPVASTRA